MIQFKTYNINHQIILTNEVLISYVSKFWDDVFSTINQNDKHLMVLCKVKYSEAAGATGYRTLGPLRRINFDDKDLFIEYLVGRLGILIESYTSNSVSEIIFTYVIKDGLATNKDRALLEDLSDKEVTFHEFNKIKLPVSMDPADYGSIRGKELIDGYTRYFVRSNNRVYEIDVSLDKLTNKVSIIGSSGLEWIDTKLMEGFKREVGKATFYFLDGELTLVKRQLPAKPFTRLRNKY